MSTNTTFLSCRLNIDTKKKLKQKAGELGLDITEFIKKIAEEEIVILDNNVKRLFNVIRLEVKNKCIATSDTKFN
jgi:antitoxin component of RelBE/YafQ-DinJ toxin-antitoxin module